jgi:hypothetical protein
MRLNHNSLTGLLGRIALVSVMPVAHDRPLAQPMCSIPLTPSSSFLGRPEVQPDTETPPDAVYLGGEG